MEPRRSTWCPALLLGLLVMLGGISKAAADKRSEARKHFNAGLSLIEAEDFDAAAAEFETSARLLPTRMGFFNLANCYKALHRYGKALDTIKHLKTVFAGNLDDKWREEIALFERTLDGIIGHFVIGVEQEGAQISVDGARVGTSPLTRKIHLAPGEHEIVVAKEGFAENRRTIHLVAGQELKVEFALMPLTGSLEISSNVDGATVYLDNEPVGRTPLVSPLVVEPGERALRVEKEGYLTANRHASVSAGLQVELEILLIEKPTSESGPTTAVPSSSRLKKWGFGTLLSGIAVAGLSGVFYGLAGSHASDFRSAKQDYSRAVETLTSVPEDAEARKLESRSWDAMETAQDNVNKWQGLGLGVAIAGGALLVTGVTLLTLAFRKVESAKPVITALPGGILFTF